MLDSDIVLCLCSLMKTPIRRQSHDYNLRKEKTPDKQLAMSLLRGGGGEVYNIISYKSSLRAGILRYRRHKLPDECKI